MKRSGTGVEAIITGGSMFDAWLYRTMNLLGVPRQRETCVYVRDMT